MIMNKNEIANFTHRVPPNSLGYFAQHSRDNVPLEPNAVLRIINGPLTAMQSKLTAELARQDRRRKETA
ncbi:MAG: hypothetical protein P4L61_03295 [Candidatus Pacebacteria bacterium]|nr:hypothetical protein [Candidatus Paceibacterota bacterium]